MAKSKTNKKQEVLDQLFLKREENIQKAAGWTLWEIEDELKRVQSARESFIEKNPNHDLSIIEEHLNQLTQSYKMKSEEIQLVEK